MGQRGLAGCVCLLFHRPHTERALSRSPIIYTHIDIQIRTERDIHRRRGGKDISSIYTYNTRTRARGWLCAPCVCVREGERARACPCSRHCAAGSPPPCWCERERLRYAEGRRRLPKQLTDSPGDGLVSKFFLFFFFFILECRIVVVVVVVLFLLFIFGF